MVNEKQIKFNTQVAQKKPNQNAETQNPTNSQRNRVNSQTSAFRSRIIRNLSSAQNVGPVLQEKQVKIEGNK